MSKFLKEINLFPEKGKEYSNIERKVSKNKTPKHIAESFFRNKRNKYKNLVLNFNDNISNLSDEDLEALFVGTSRIRFKNVDLGELGEKFSYIKVVELEKAKSFLPLTIEVIKFLSKEYSEIQLKELTFDFIEDTFSNFKFKPTFYRIGETAFLKNPSFEIYIEGNLYIDKTSIMVQSGKNFIRGYPGDLNKLDKKIRDLVVKSLVTAEILGEN